MSDRVDITLPSGEAATVPRADLEQALAAGATTKAVPASTEDSGGLLGAVAAGILGAGSTATLGLTDKLAREIPYVIGGDAAARQVTDQLRMVRERNPGSTFAGEVGGLLLNPEAFTAAGELAEAPIAARAGTGLLSKMATSAVRMGAETAVGGAQHAITEESLGNHDLNAQAIWSQAAKEGMLGVGGGALLGLGGGLLGKTRDATGLLARRPGPTSGALLDELTGGVEGAGKGVRDSVSRAETTIDGLRATGATSDQAIEMVQGLEDAARARVEARRVLIDPEMLDAGLYGEPEIGRAIRPDGSTDYAKVTKRISLGDIDVPPPWDPTKLPPIRAAREAGTELDPIKIGRMTDEEPWSIVDGIHRANVAAERGEKDILARFEIETKPQRLSDNVTELGKVPAEPAPFRFSEAVTPETAPAIAPEVVRPEAVRAEASSIYDRAAEKFIRQHAGNSPERAGLLWKHYRESVAPIEAAISKVEQTALDMRKAGTSFLRNGDDVLNEAQFAMKPERFAKLVDKTRLDVQADAVAQTMQDLDATLSFWEGTAAKGGLEGGLKKLRSAWKDVNTGLLDLASGGSKDTGRDLFVRMNRLKQVADSYVPYGRASGAVVDGKSVMFGLPEATQDIRKFADGLRGVLEDESVWGEAGAAQARENKSFSDMFARFNDFKSTFGVSIDQSMGVRIPEIDFARTRGVLEQVKGIADVDESLQPIISARSTISGMRSRIEALHESGELTRSQTMKLAQAEKDLTAFESALNGAMKEAGLANRLKAARLEEGKSGIGGLLGAGLDTVTRPFATLERMAHIKHTQEKVTSGLKAAFKAVTESGGSSTEGVAARAVSPRSKEKVIEEMQTIREIAGNPARLQETASRMVGDLSKYAPQTAAALHMTAVRALVYLAREAPPASVSQTGAFGTPKGRYSDVQIHDWETKRNAAYDPRDVVEDMKHGRLNRDAVKTAQFVAPEMFAEMQRLAQSQLDAMASRGELDRVPYQQQAVIASLLKVHADRTFEPDFLAMMQAVKAAPPPQAPGRPGGGSSGPAKPPAWLQTEAQQIEAGGF